MQELQMLHDAIVKGDAKVAKTATKEALDAGTEAFKLVQDYMIPAMKEVGRRFECSEYFVPELLLSARAMKVSMELIRPLLLNAGVQPVGRVAIGTVLGDLHDIGKNLVASMLEGGGYEVIDLGVNVPAENFVSAVQEKNVDIVAMSALLTTTMPAMKTTMDALCKAGVRQRIKVLVGGAPITQKFADDIGADGFSDNAAGAVNVAKRLAIA
jgi:corrinoid protein of di/trimethylamine methyltransferase